MLALRCRRFLKPALGEFWLLMVTVGTIRTLRRLGALEKEHPEPTAAMKLAFEMATIQPILGIVPLLLAFA